MEQQKAEGNGLWGKIMGWLHRFETRVKHPEAMSNR